MVSFDKAIVLVAILLLGWLFLTRGGTNAKR